ncbi:BadF/BadG/BcrA/BcrD ATPase family protein [Colwellia sp. MEBiC06753]
MNTTNKNKPLFLGIDGGGTKCRARIEDSQGMLIGQGLGGPANLVRGVSSTITSIMAATSQALMQAKLSHQDLARVHAVAGLAGANVEQAKQEFLDWQHPFASLTVTTDMAIACYGAHQDQNGGVIILGTGFCAGLTINQQVSEFGGYGLYLGDKASGSSLGLSAVQYGLKVFDGVEPATDFSQQILTTVDCQTLEQLLSFALSAQPNFFAQLAPIVFEYADKGCVIAVNIVQQAADFIDLYANHLLAHDINRLCLVGGIASKITPWLPKSLQTQLNSPISNAEQGALWLARQQLS